MQKESKGLENPCNFFRRVFSIFVVFQCGGIFKRIIEFFRAGLNGRFTIDVIFVCVTLIDSNRADAFQQGNKRRKSKDFFGYLPQFAFSVRVLDGITIDDKTVFPLF